MSFFITVNFEIIYCSILITILKQEQKYKNNSICSTDPSFLKPDFTEAGNSTGIMNDEKFWMLHPLYNAPITQCLHPSFSGDYKFVLIFTTRVYFFITPCIYLFFCYL
jgi:hypothetical protein